MSDLAELLRASPYQAYSYAYPHKTAYRPIAPRPLSQVWADEDRRALFLYAHIPFCTYRCGFCNLFTLARPSEQVVARYLQQIQAQLRTTIAALGEHRFARFALGGGTPSYLDVRQLADLFEALGQSGVDLHAMPAGIEVSPETVDGEKMQLVREVGIDRVSMGIQSFADAEVRALIRPQQRAQVERAIAAIRDANFPTLNLDLIYGIEGQSIASFLASIESALAFAPEEIYLYPLYVRPLTGLGRTGSRRFALAPEPLADRALLYEAGRDALRAAGYRQISMRMFRAAHAPSEDGVPAYCCQTDGMVGIGCGARSYTRDVHYSTEFGVSRRSVNDILEDYLQRDSAAFATVDYGFELDAEEQRRRFVIQSLLLAPGLDRRAYRARFGGDCLDEISQLRQLQEFSLAHFETDRIVLTDAGLARADTIGPWLTSPAVSERMAAYELT